MVKNEVKKMQKYNRWADRLGDFIQIISLIGIAILGLTLLYFLFDELWTIVKLGMRPDTIDNYYVLLEGIVTFFLFFEFIAMVVNILHNGGHVSVNFLLGLGITALVRGLLSNHSKPLDTLLIALAVLALVGSTILLTRFLHEGEE